MIRRWQQDKDKCEKCSKFVKACTLVTTEGLETDKAIGHIGSVCQKCYDDQSVDWDQWLRDQAAGCLSAGDKIEVVELAQNLSMPQCLYSLKRGTVSSVDGDYIYVGFESAVAYDYPATMDGGGVPFLAKELKKL